MVVEEFSPATRQEGNHANRTVVVPLSARTQEQLQQKGRDLLEFIESSDQALDLSSLAWTLQTGREAMVERVGFVVRSLDQLTDELRAWLAGERTSPVKDEQLESWVQGAAADWAPRWGNVKPKRMSLPGYPFARERYWAGVSGSIATDAAPPASQNLEDILDRIDDDSLDAEAGVQLLKTLV
jgi:polyketide synthase PksL